MTTLTAIDSHLLAAVTGGAGSCGDLVEDMKGVIHDSYAKDDHAYAQRRMDSFGPGLDAIRRNCENLQRTNGDAPVDRPLRR